jgi:hypothetical protein
VPQTRGPLKPYDGIVTRPQPGLCPISFKVEVGVRGLAPIKRRFVPRAILDEPRDDLPDRYAAHHQPLREREVEPRK